MMLLSQHQRHLCLTLCHHVIAHFRWKGKHASKCSSTGNHTVVHRGGLSLGERTMTPDFVAQVSSKYFLRISVLCSSFGLSVLTSNGEVKTRQKSSCAFVDCFLMRLLSATPLSSKYLCEDTFIFYKLPAAGVECINQKSSQVPQTLLYISNRYQTYY